MFDHRYGFDPTYGYTAPRLMQVRAPQAPPGFELFWQATYHEARATPPRPVLTRVRSGRPDVAVFEIKYAGVGNFVVGGWLTRPVGVEARRGVVIGHGYGGRQGPELDVPGPPSVCLFPCARGFHRSARPDLPASAATHVLRGIEHRETYLHRLCVADLWSAVSALIEVAPEVAGMIDYAGTSFGGGLGAMALPWEPRIRRAFLGVPSFGNHPLRVTLPCVGSGEAVRLLYQRKPEILETLAYFDSATAATFCRKPVLVSCALFDPAVPPPGQFCVYNSLAGEKELFIRQTDHFAWSGSEDESRKLFQAQVSCFGRA
jgi:cephalosporin-C deacetylase